LTFAVYGTDAFTTDDGAFALLPASQPATDVGSWISFAGGTHTVAPGRWVDLAFRLTVPDNATPGDHVGGVIGAVAQPGAEAPGQRVTVDRRVAARVYLRVAGEVRPALAVTSMTVRYDNPLNPFGGGDATVTYRLHNAGNVRVGGTGAVTIAGPFGWRLARTDRADLPELLPGGTFTVTERVTGVPPALRLTAEADVAPTTIDTALPPVIRSATAWAPPWLLLAGLLVVAAAALLRRRRRQRHPRPAGTGDGGAASGAPVPASTSAS
jgi:LPXTG-motif cell wall-anchored protein